MMSRICFSVCSCLSLILLFISVGTLGYTGTCPPFDILHDSAAIHQILTNEAVSRLEQLGHVSDAKTYLERTFLSPASVKAGKIIQDWMVDAGLNTWMDEIGNIHGRTDGSNSSAPALLIGSHLDTVIGGGKYDGALGIVTAIAAVKSMNEQGKLSRFPRPIEVIAFSDEEGVRFQSTFLGSAAVAGTFSTDLLSIRDKNGTTLREAMQHVSLMGTEESLLALKYDTEAVWGYIEVHIEQGPVLEFKGIPLGVVDAIAGQTRLKVIMQGVQGHAGTVPMQLRKDPMPAAAEAIIGIEELCKTPYNHLERASTPNGPTSPLVCTVGEISSWPGTSNVIPGQVIFTVDIRSKNDNVRKQTVSAVGSKIQIICTTRGLKCNIEKKHEAKAVECDEELTRRLTEAAKSGLSRVWDGEASDVPILTSGAGHDAMALAHLTKVGMIFVRCTGGISHSPDEHVLDDDVGAASFALLSFLEQELAMSDPGDTVSRLKTDLNCAGLSANLNQPESIKCSNFF